MAAPANDDFANVTLLNPDGGDLPTETTVDATSETHEPVFVEGTTNTLLRDDASFTFQSVWYKLTADRDGAWHFIFSPTATVLEIAVYRGSTLSDLEFVSFQLNGDVWAAALEGEVLFVQVYNYSGGTPPGTGTIGVAQPFGLAWERSPFLKATVAIDDVSYGPFLAGGGRAGESALLADHMRDVWFGAWDSGSPNDRQIRNIKIGSTSPGSSDLFNPLLDDLSEFDTIQGDAAGISASAGVLTVANAGLDAYATKDLGADITYPIYVHYEVKSAADEIAGGFIGDAHNIAASVDDSAWLNGIYADMSVPAWAMESHFAADGADRFGDGPTADVWTSFDIVWDMGGSPPAPPAAAARVVSPPWRFVLTTLNQAVLSFLDHRMTNRQLHYYLRQAPTASGRVYAADPEINLLHTDGEPFLAEGVRILLGLRREGGDPPWVPRFAGILTQATRITEGDTQYVDFTAYGPRQYLYKRPARMADGSLIPRGGRNYKQVRGSDILLEQIALTVAQDGPVFIDVDSGHIADTDPIDFTVQQGATVGDILDALEQTGTMDILLPAVWDPDGNPGNLAQLNIYPLAGNVQNGAIMAYDLFPHSLQNHDWLEDGEQRANSIEFSTVNGLLTPVVFDAASVAKYRAYWAQQTFPAQAGISAIEAEAGIELITRRAHPTTLTITPLPERAPVPFNEYGLADWLPTYISARSGKLLAGYYRVLEIPVSVLDDAVETVTGLVMSSDLPPDGTVFPSVPVTGGGGGGTAPDTPTFGASLSGTPIGGDDIDVVVFATT